MTQTSVSFCLSVVSKFFKTLNCLTGTHRKYGWFILKLNSAASNWSTHNMPMNCDRVCLIFAEHFKTTLTFPWVTSAYKN